MKSLDSLLGKEEPNGTFHDSSLLSINVDYNNKRLVADFDICVGDPAGKNQKSSERYRRGRLNVEGLQ